MLIKEFFELFLCFIILRDVMVNGFFISGLFVGDDLVFEVFFVVNDNLNREVN